MLNNKLFLSLAIFFVSLDSYADRNGQIVNNSGQDWTVSTKSQYIVINNTAAFTPVIIKPGEKVTVSYHCIVPWWPGNSEDTCGKIKIMDYKKQTQKTTVRENVNGFSFAFYNGFRDIIDFQDKTYTITIKKDAWV